MLTQLWSLLPPAGGASPRDFGTTLDAVRSGTEFFDTVWSLLRGCLRMSRTSHALTCERWLPPTFQPQPALATTAPKLGGGFGVAAPHSRSSAFSSRSSRSCTSPPSRLAGAHLRHRRPESTARERWYGDRGCRAPPAGDRPRGRGCRHRSQRHLLRRCTGTTEACWSTAAARALGIGSFKAVSPRTLICPASTARRSVVSGHYRAAMPPSRRRRRGPEPTQRDDDVPPWFAHALSPGRRFVRNCFLSVPSAVRRSRFGEPSDRRWPARERAQSSTCAASPGA